jgi:5-methylcytosine-specific restriction protein A
MLAQFERGTLYTRKKIRSLLGIENPNNIGGIWSTGYVQYQDEFYIFSTISDAGRTGHNYANRLDNGILYWYTKNRDNFYVPTIQKMVSGEYPVHIFTRYDSSDPNFIYQGQGHMIDFENGKPAFISWKIVNEDK